MKNKYLLIGAIYMALAILFMFTPFPISLFSIFFFIGGVINYYIWNLRRDDR